MTELWFRGQLQEMRRDECLQLVGSKPVGRIGYCSARGAIILPVNHAVIAGDIVVRVDPSGETARYLHEHGHGAPLSYQVDELDDRSQAGWSVLVTGTARAADPEALFSLTDRPVPWPAGGYWEYVRIHPDRVTGRRLVHR